jgi:hypothetical protein
MAFVLEPFLHRVQEAECQWEQNEKEAKVGKEEV